MMACLDRRPFVDGKGNPVSALGVCKKGVIYRCEAQGLVVEDCGASGQECHLDTAAKRLRCETGLGRCAELEGLLCTSSSISESEYCCLDSLSVACDRDANNINLADCAEQGESIVCGLYNEYWWGEGLEEVVAGCHEPCQDGESLCGDNFVVSCEQGMWKLVRECWNGCDPDTLECL